MTAQAPDGGPLDQEELRGLLSLLARYCAYDLDQWDNWRLDLPRGPFYVSIANRLLPGAADETYSLVWPPSRI